MALNNGANWIDSTVLGMGRGPGNVKTENMRWASKHPKKNIEIITYEVKAASTREYTYIYIYIYTY